MDLKGFLQIENVRQHQKQQMDSVKGKDCPYRVEFRFSGGTKHWQYFQTLADTQDAWGASCRYSIFGQAIVEWPLSIQLQIRGPRGGWSIFKGEKVDA